MMDVFISYSHHDDDFAKDIAERLKAKGLKFFLDKQMDAGKNFMDEINEHLRACKEVFALITHNSINSDWVRFECGAARALGKHISPILIGCTAESLPDVLRYLQAKRYSEIDEVIKACVGRKRDVPGIIGDWEYKYSVNADRKFGGISAIFEGTVKVEKSKDRYRLKGMRLRETCEGKSQEVEKPWNTAYAELSPDESSSDNMLKAAYEMEGVSRGFMFLRIPRKGPIAKFGGEAVLLVDASREMQGTIVHGTIEITRKGNKRPRSHGGNFHPVGRKA